MTNTANYGWSKEALTGEVASFPNRLGSVLDSIDTSLATALASKTTTALPINAQTGTTYSFALSDAGKTVTANNSSASTFNIPLEATVAWVTATELRLYNIGAGTVTITCTSGTLAGTVTVPKYGFVTLKKTGTNTWYGIAQDKAVSSGGLILVAASTYSAASAVSINNCFTSAYENYRVIINGYASTGAGLSIRMRAGGTDNSSATYYSEILQLNNTALSAALNGGLTSFVYGTIDGARQFTTMDISEPQLAVATNTIFHRIRSGTTAIVESGVGYFSGSNQFDGLTVYPSTGTITGTIRIYGYTNSL